MTVRIVPGVAMSFLLAGGCLLAVTGCSSNSVTATTAPPTVLSSAAADSTAPPTALSSASSSRSAANSAGTSAAAASAGQAVCNTLTPADVQFLLADPAIGPTVTAIGTDSDGQQCDFNNADDDETVEVQVFPSADPALGFAAQQQSESSSVPVAGVGDQAFRDADDYLPTAEANGITCSVSASVDEIPAASSLIVDGHSITLTGPQEDIVATALGTLCNKIFGSGPTTPDLSQLHS